MITRAVTYDNYNDETVTENFNFNITKLEAIELEIKFEGGLEGHIQRIATAGSAVEAFDLFKDIVLSAYGKKSPDGRTFHKKDPVDGHLYRYDLEASPALGELILGFIERPEEGAAFIEGCLPKRLVEAAKAEAAKGGDVTEPVAPVLPTSAPVLEKPNAEKTVKDYSREELLEMSQDAFDMLAGTDPLKMDPVVLQVAYLRKNRS